MFVINKTVFIRVVLAILIAATLTFIWSNSLADASESSKMSGAVIEIVKPIVDPQDRIDDDLFVKIVRETAHFSEFALLGAEVFLLIVTFDRWRKATLPSFILSVGSSFVCAVTDELLQLTSEGRSCEFLDMMIDLGGITAGVIFVVLMHRSFVHIRYKKRNTKTVGE